MFVERFELLAFASTSGALIDKLEGDLPSLVYSRSNPEDIDASCEQHAVDALRYGLTRRKRVTKVVPVRWAF